MTCINDAFVLLVGSLLCCFQMWLHLKSGSDYEQWLHSSLKSKWTLGQWGEMSFNTPSAPASTYLLISTYLCSFPFSYIFCNSESPVRSPRLNASGQHSWHSVVYLKLSKVQPTRHFSFFFNRMHRFPYKIISPRIYWCPSLNRWHCHMYCAPTKASAHSSQPLLHCCSVELQ